MKTPFQIRSTLLPTIATFILAAGALTSHSAAQSPEAGDITATRAAEQTEVADLRETVAWLETEIAVLLAPTATPTPEPTATTVPPRPAGETLPLGEEWEVQALALTMAPTWEDYVADGQFARVQLVITNLGETPTRFPFDKLLLRDATGRVFVPDMEVLLDLGAGWIFPFDPNIPSDGFIIFDIATDASGPFILESTEDPTFRVLVEEEVRG